jgi:dihydrofolate reductase
LAVPGPTRIEAYAIVSEDGMLADASRVIPAALKVEADHKFFFDGLRQAVVVVQGRHSHEGGDPVPGRYRLIATRKVAGLMHDPSQPEAPQAKTLLWNPQRASLQEAWTALGAPSGMLAVVGGPDVYELFLGIGYDAFHLSRVAGMRVPSGRPVFPEIGPQRTPEDVLRSHGLRPGPPQILDAAKKATLVTWTR